MKKVSHLQIRNAAKTSDEAREVLVALVPEAFVNKIDPSMSTKEMATKVYKPIAKQLLYDPDTLCGNFLKVRRYGSMAFRGLILSSIESAHWRIVEDNMGFQILTPSKDSG